ncbi:hypothetical protein Fcan01_11392 [Folsomia candida]|uniref:Uncharacterized protein n=1 Tax=Folsomia candida TaxID=158441 RepID=A0A226EDM5_FOLCA|nr:hypothetical protein Fcan01_11392 [Folsomia candida]
MKYNEDESKCDPLQHFVSRIFRQDVIFGNVDLTRGVSCFKSVPIQIFIGTATLVLFDNSQAASLFIPCLTCDPVTFSQLEVTISLRNIQQAWDAANRDMHKYLIRYFLLEKESANSICGLVHGGYIKLDDPVYCFVVIMAEKYNLTLIRQTKSDRVNRRVLRSFGRVMYNRVQNISRTEILVQVSLSPINLGCVTDPPLPATGVATFISPLDFGTWTCLAVSITVVAGFLTCLACKGANLGSWSGVIVTVMCKIFTVTSILIGQVGDSTGSNYRARKIIMVFLIFWFCGNLLLMSNLYQGSIVPLPQPTPNGVADLVNWNIPVVAMDVLYNSEINSVEAYLIEYNIPELLLNNDLNQQFKRFLIKLHSKLLSYGDHAVARMISKIQVEDSSKSHQTLAILIIESELGLFVQNVNIFGNRRVVIHHGSSPFQVVELITCGKNMLALYIKKELGRILQAGLLPLWRKYSLIGLILGRMQNGNRRHKKYFKAVQYLIGDPKNSPTFHEATPVSIGLIRPIFAICAVLVGISLLEFLVENHKLVILWGELIGIEGILLLFGSRGQILCCVLIISRNETCQAT